MDGALLPVLVDYDSVLVGPFRLSGAQTEEFAQLFVAACWQAGAQQGRMGEEPAMNAAEAAMDELAEVGNSMRIGGQAVSVQTGRRTDGTRVLAQQGGITALLDPDCRDGKHTSCVGPPCECGCHVSP